MGPPGARVAGAPLPQTLHDSPTWRRTRCGAAAGLAITDAVGLTRHGPYASSQDLQDPVRGLNEWPMTDAFKLNEGLATARLKRAIIGLNLSKGCPLISFADDKKERYINHGHLSSQVLSGEHP